MRHRLKLAGFFMAFSLLLVGFGLPKKIQKKVDKEIQKTFEISNFQLEPVSVDPTLNKTLPIKLNDDKLFMLKNAEQHLGYVFVDKAPSKTAEFDYLVIFDPQLKIKHSKVLIYREEYGGEIGSKRWLKQFLGKCSKDRVSHETNIDAISGATISVRSMTNSMDNLLQTIGILQEKNIL